MRSEIWEPNDEGWYDLTLLIEDIRLASDASCTVRAYGKYKNEIVGLAVTFKGGMKPGMVGAEFDRSAFEKEGIIYASVGPESDALLSAMSSLYGKKLQGKSFTKRIAATTFALDGNPANIQNEPLKFKAFFFDTEGEGKYAELYTNIDIPKKRLELFEKDEEYRQNVLNALSTTP